ncbi:MAG: hypothetical protein HYZ72_21780 [Deltaproteobacteria bacterium]|nr:hypothetical protein [Deltaproteobacteria bacterium]
MSKGVWLGIVALCVLCVLGGAITLLAQEVTLNQLFAGDLVVTGKAAPASAPITVFDTSFEVPTALGSGTAIDAEGNFAVSVDPPLVEGHTITAKDAQGRASSPVSIFLAGPPAGGP